MDYKICNLNISASVSINISFAVVDSSKGKFSHFDLMKNLHQLTLISTALMTENTEESIDNVRRVCNDIYLRYFPTDFNDSSNDVSNIQISYYNMKSGNLFDFHCDSFARNLSDEMKSSEKLIILNPETVVCLDSSSNNQTLRRINSLETMSSIENRFEWKAYLSERKYPAIFEFPGTFDQQIVRFVVSDRNDLIQYDISNHNQLVLSVLAFVYNESKELLLVHHKTRGWELPGGKLEPNESFHDAVVREVYEESAVKITNLYELGHYEIYNSYKEYQMKQPCHFKVVYMGRVECIDNLDAYDTDDKKFMIPPSVEEVMSEEYSPLMKDNVYSIGLKISTELLSEPL